MHTLQNIHSISLYINKWTWTWKGLLTPHASPWHALLQFQTRHMVAVSCRVNEMMKRRSRRERITCQELNHKFTAFSSWSQTCSKKAQYNCLAVHFIVCIDDEWRHRTPQNVVIITIYTLILFLFFSWSHFLHPKLSRATTRAENRSSSPHIEPLKDHSWSWLKARRGRGRPGWWMLSPPSPAPCKAICYGVVTVK